MNNKRSNAVINQAIGLLIGRHGLDQQGALDLLRSVASERNSTVHEVALRTVNQHDDKAKERKRALLALGQPIPVRLDD